MREPLRDMMHTRCSLGITPACAGTTFHTRRALRCRQDHPRVCGNHSVFTPAPDPAAGSPPRVREPRLSRGSDRTSGRITPACAGTTKSQFRIDIFTEDHPRVCGNHAPCLLLSACYLGSPPRVREPLLQVRGVDHVFGITPACAGTTAAVDSAQPSGRDHPRVCGNHKSGLSAVHPRPGSPPRVREPLRADLFREIVHGITPACAGTTPGFFQSAPGARDHPRVCGNHSGTHALEKSLSGSPPRVREPRTPIRGDLAICRITPACAGTTTGSGDREIQK